MPHSFGKCVLVDVKGVRNLVMYFQNVSSQGIYHLILKASTFTKVGLLHLMKLNKCMLVTTNTAEDRHYAIES